MSYASIYSEVSKVDDEERGEVEQIELADEEEESAYNAFMLLDEDGDGVIDLQVLQKFLITCGRLPLDEELIEIMTYATDEGSEGAFGMSHEGFRRYLMKNLVNTTNEEELRTAFQVFDPEETGKVNLTELRHHLKHTGLKLTDDEIDFLFREEDYWMLEEKNFFEYEELIKKLLNKPDCKNRFLNCSEGQ